MKNTSQKKKAVRYHNDLKESIVDIVSSTHSINKCFFLITPAQITIYFLFCHMLYCYKNRLVFPPKVNNILQKIS